MTHSATGTTLRNADIEAKFRSEILEAVLATQDSSQLRVILLDKVFGTVAFLELPKYRQSSLEGYFLGICDILAKLPASRPASGIRPAVKRPPGRPRKTPPPPKPKSLPSALLTRIESLPRRAAFTIIPPPPGGGSDPQTEN